MCKLCGQCAAEAIGGPLACITCEQEGYMRGYENEHYAVLGRCFEKLAQEIGGETEDGIRLLEGLAREMRKSNHGKCYGQYQAVGMVNSEFLALEECVSMGGGGERAREQAMRLLAETARFWLGEHNA